MREWIKQNKLNLALFGGVLLLYAFLFAARAFAAEAPRETAMEYLPYPGQVLHAIHTLNAAVYEAQAILQDMLEKIDALQETQIGFNHWSLALAAFQIALLVIIIFALVWGKK